MSATTLSGAPLRRSRLRRLLPTGSRAVVGVAGLVLLVMLVLAIAGSAIAPHNPSAQSLVAANARPGHGFLLGTDSLGRDLFSRVLAGTRSALEGPLVIALGAMVISVFFGIISGYIGGLLDTVIMRGVDVGYALPPLLVAIVVAGVVSGGYWVAVAVLVVLSAPYDIRIIRAVTLEQRQLPYIEAARVLGLNRRQIMVRHILPNVVPFIIVDLCLDFAFALVTLSGLSFLGLGAPPGSPDWGRMLSDNQALVFTNALGALAPGIMIVLTAAAVSIVGDWVAERFAARGVRA
jgi:peptide/nickel transport system permease protein